MKEIDPVLIRHGLKDLDKKIHYPVSLVAQFRVAPFSHSHECEKGRHKRNRGFLFSNKMKVDTEPFEFGAETLDLVFDEVFEVLRDGVGEDKVNIFCFSLSRESERDLAAV